MIKQVFSVAGKELRTYFGSPMAAIFMGAFLLFTLFFFFWIDAFFARNSADIRPLFRWMPLLLIFLAATLTMRQWSEEQRMGTMEVLLTLPVSLTTYVLGKFLAVLTLVAISLLLTAGLPITVSLMGNLDWGPVIGGYLGALLMACAYIAIGLFVSSRTDNQIVAMITTVLIAGLFYLVGSAPITSLAGNDLGELLRAFGTGSRFASIERGVLDLRDIVYYLSITVVFLGLNVLSLDMKRWSSGARTARYRRGAIVTTVLLVCNILVLNIWLYRVNAARIDLTENREFSISQTTRDLLSSLREPLLLRGYFSEKTHPLLAPLVPHIKDLMKEYAIAGHGKVKVEFVDPRQDREAEIEANQEYGIKPVPFRVAGRYESSVVNSYFHILVRYGDQYKVLGFEDIIEVTPLPDGQPEVKLRNLEYDLTRAIKKVVYGFQSIGNVFENIKKAQLTAIITPDKLPESLKDLPKLIEEAADDIKKDAMGKFSYELIDPDSISGGREKVEKEFGVKPQLASLFSNKTLYLYLFLDVDGKRQQIHLDADPTKAEIEQEIEAALKRMSSGFLKTVGIWTPKEDIPPQLMMMGRRPSDHYRMVQEILKQDYNVKEVTLDNGWISGDIDVLLLVAPQDMDDVERVAVDQFLMRGGSVIALAGSYVLDLSSQAGRALRLKKVKNGISELLSHYGVTVKEELVMDRRNEPFPVPVERNIGGFIVQEIRRLDYPFFVDVRPDSMAENSPITSSLTAVTMNWASPIVVDAGKKAGHDIVELLHTSPEAWTTESTDIQPDFEKYPGTGFPQPEKFKVSLLALTDTGSFTSFFKDKPDPRVEKLKKEHEKKEKEKAKKDSGQEANSADKTADEVPPPPIIERSPDTTRLAVVGSSEFVNDTVISISRSLNPERFLNSLTFVQNLVDWAVEDLDLLAIRAREGHARLLKPMDRNEQRFYEILNYCLAFAGLLLVSLVGRGIVRNEKPIRLD